MYNVLPRNTGNLFCCFIDTKLWQNNMNLFFNIHAADRVLFYITAKLTNQFIQTGLRTFDWQQLFTWLWWWLPLRLSKRQSPLPTTVQDCTHPNDQTTVLHATYILFVSTSIPLMHIYPIFSVRKDFHCFSPLWTARRTGHSQRLHRKWRRIVCTASSARRNDRAERVWGNPNNNLLTTIHRGGEGKWLIFTTVNITNSILQRLQNPTCVARRWITKDTRSLSCQSEHTFNAIHCFSLHW